MNDAPEVFKPAPEWASPYEAALLHQIRQLQYEITGLKHQLGQFNQTSPLLYEPDFEKRQILSRINLPAKVEMYPAASWSSKPDRLGLTIEGRARSPSDPSSDTLIIQTYIPREDIFDSRLGVTQLLGKMQATFIRRLAEILIEEGAPR